MTAMDTQSSLISTAIAAAPGSDPQWLNDLRQQGRDFFEKNGLPTRKDEDWNETPLKSLAKLCFVAPESEGSDDIAPTIPGFETAYRMTCVDGQVIATGESLPAGVVVSSLAEAIESHGDIVEAKLGKLVSAEAGAFAALNAAHLSAGVFVYVPKGVIVDKPIELAFGTRQQAEPTASHIRVLVIIEDKAEAHVYEHHHGPNGYAYLTNSVTEIFLGAKSLGSHTFLEREGDEAFNVSTLASEQQSESDFTSHAMLLGGKLVRNNCRPTIAGQRVESTLNGLYLPDGDRLIDNQMYVHHKAPGCHSRQFYSGILTEKAKGIFAGRIKVERPAQQTDAVQESKVLLLSEDAHAHNRPQLEIFADDVKCTHGSTTGQIDEEHLFYLQARGINRKLAEGMMIFAFANEAIERIEHEPVRAFLRHLIVQQLNLNADVEHVFE